MIWFLLAITSGPKQTLNVFSSLSFFAYSTTAATAAASVSRNRSVGASNTHLLNFRMKMFAICLRLPSICIGQKKKQQKKLLDYMSLKRFPSSPCPSLKRSQ